MNEKAFNNLEKKEKDLILLALNDKYHATRNKLNSVTLGNLERKMYEEMEVSTLALIRKLEN